MFKFTSMNRKNARNNLVEIEGLLQSSLKPVSPRPEFIQGLRRGLMEYSFPKPEMSDSELKRTVLIALVGFFSMVFVFSMWVRMIVALISALGMVQASKRDKGATSSNLQQAA
jgi:polyferredoxin